MFYIYIFDIRYNIKIKNPLGHHIKNINNFHEFIRHNADSSTLSLFKCMHLHSHIKIYLLFFVIFNHWLKLWFTLFNTIPCKNKDIKKPRHYLYRFNNTCTKIWQNIHFCICQNCFHIFFNPCMCQKNKNIFLYFSEETILHLANDEKSINHSILNM